MEATDPDAGDGLKYEWFAAGVSGCGAFRLDDGGRRIVWGPHDNESQCPHDASGAHPIQIVVVITDACGGRVTRAYNGSLDGTGSPADATAAAAFRSVASSPARGTCGAR